MRTRNLLYVLAIAGSIGIGPQALAEFDRTDIGDLRVLCEEGVNNPLNLEGFGNALDYWYRNNSDPFYRIMNDPLLNRGGEEGLAELTPAVVLSALTISEYKRMPDEARSYLALFVGRDFFSDLEPFREQLAEALPKTYEFPLRRLSRAEVLFGQGTRISRADQSTTFDRWNQNGQNCNFTP